MCVRVGSGFGFEPATPGWVVRVCVFVCALRLYPANPGWGVRFGCVCLASGLRCPPPLLAWGVGVCVLVCVLRLNSASPCWGLWCVCVCLGLGFYPASPGWGVGLCALHLYPTNPGYVLLSGCVCLGSDFSCAPPFLARGVRMCDERDKTDGEEVEMEVEVVRAGEVAQDQWTIVRQGGRTIRECGRRCSRSRYT